MRQICTFLMLALWLGVPMLAEADFVKYRTRDGRIGFAQDTTGVPAGATVISEDQTSGNLVIETDQKLGRRPNRSRGQSINQTIEEIDRDNQNRRKEESDKRSSIRTREKEAEEARKAASHACTKVRTGRGRYGKGVRRFRGDCKAARHREQAAAAAFKKESVDLDEEGWDVEEFLEKPEAEERDEPEEADDDDD